MRDQKENQIVWWVDNLGLLEACHIIRISGRKAYSVEKIHFFRAVSWPARWLVRLFLGVTNQHIARKEYDLSVFDVPMEENLYWKVYREYPQFALQVAAESLADKPTMDPIEDKEVQSTIEHYLRRQIALEQRRNLSLIRLVAYYHSSSENHPCALVNAGAFASYVEKYAAAYKIKLFSYARVNYRVLIVCRLGYMMAQWLFTCFVHGLLSIGDLFLSKRNKEGKEPSRVGVCYAQGIDLTRKSDLFWLKNSCLNTGNILVYFKDSPKPLTLEIRKQLQELNVRYFNLIPWWEARPHNKLGDSKRFLGYFRGTLIKEIVSLFRLSKQLFKKGHAVELWQHERLIWLFYTVAQFEALFRCFNVKVNTGLFADSDPHIEAIHIVTQRVKGADVYVHWSNHPMEKLWGTHDVFFTWGPYFRPVYERVGHGIKYLLYSGYLFDSIIPQVSMRAQNYRKKLQEKGVEFVLSLFDGAYGRGGWFSVCMLREFYKTILQEVRAHMTWGIIIKTKRTKSFKEMMSPEICEAIEALEKSGRCLVLDSQEMPATAAQASDVAMGFGVFSTPAVEAALSQIPAIVYDSCHMHFHPFYTKGHRRIVFDKLSDLSEAVREYCQSPGNRPGFGDYSFVLPQIDPFQDKRASERIGQYMGTLLNELSKPGTKEEALQKANTFYKNKYGTDKVVDYLYPPEEDRGDAVFMDYKTQLLTNS